MKELFSVLVGLACIVIGFAWLNSVAAGQISVVFLPPVVVVLLAMLLICFGVFAISDYGIANSEKIDIVALWVVLIALSLCFWYFVFKTLGIFALAGVAVLFVGFAWLIGRS